MNSEFFFRRDFLYKLRQAARKYGGATREASKHQWSIARMVNAEWPCVEAKFEGEITKDHFYMAASFEINAVLPFSVCSASGETLRRWCEVVKSFENADTSMLETALSFEHFRVARSLAKLPKNELEGNTPMVILQRAAQEGWTVDEMKSHYGDEFDKPSEYDRAVGWLDSLQTSQFEWVKDRSKRDEIKALLSRLREILK